MSKTKALLAGVALIYQDTVLPLSPVSTDLSSVGSSISVLRADSSDAVLLDGAPWFLRAEFVREGSDLHLSGPDGQKLIIQEYFYQDPPPDLINPNGVAINGAVVTQLAGPQVPVQYAQSTPADVTEPIGQIETVTGQVKVTHVDRTESILSLGDPVFAGDILETDGDGVVGIIFADQSTFSLGENGRMTLDEMVYDPGTQEGSMAINMLQGAFTFVSGQVAKTDVDAMTIVTPTAVIGVRGSAAGGFIGKQGGLTVSLLPEIGLNGELSITNPVGSETINVPGQSTNVSTLNAPPSGVFTLTPEQMGQAFGSALAGLPNGGNVIPAEIRNGANQGRQLQQAAEEAITEAEAKQADAEAKVAVAEQIQADAQSQVAAAEAAMLQEQAQADAVAAEAQAAEVAALEAVAQADTLAGEAAAAEALAAQALAAAQAAGATEVELTAAQAAAGAAKQAQAAANIAATEAQAAESIQAQVLIQVQQELAQAQAAIAQVVQTSIALAQATSNVANINTQLASAALEVAKAQIAVLQTSPVGAIALGAARVGIIVEGARELDNAVKVIEAAQADVVQAKQQAAQAQADVISAEQQAEAQTDAPPPPSEEGPADEGAAPPLGEGSIDEGAPPPPSDTKLGLDPLAGPLEGGELLDFLGVGSELLDPIDPLAPEFVFQEPLGLGPAEGPPPPEEDAPPPPEKDAGADAGTTFIGTTGIDNFTTGDTNDLILALANTSDSIDTFTFGKGNDTINFQGGSGNYFLSFANLSGPITVDLTNSSNQVIKGTGGSDGSVNFTNLANVKEISIRGTSGNDTYIGSNNTNFFSNFRGGAGNDTITGNAAKTRLDYKTAASGITIDMSTGQTTNDGDGGVDTFTGIREVRGSNFTDNITGSSNNESFIGRGGNDIIDGGGGFDTIRYNRSDIDSPGVVVNLTTGLATGSFSGISFSHTLSNIENIRGSDFNDTITGGAGNDRINAGSGNDTVNGGAGNDFIQAGLGTDTIDGGAGFDFVSYKDIATNTTGASGITYTGGNGGAASSVTITAVGTDTLTNIEGVVGTNFADTFTGGDGDERFDPLGGVDTINGGAGNDTLAYQGEEGSTGVTFVFSGDSGGGTVTDTDGNTDTFTGIESALGSIGNDTITGDNGVQRVFVSDGNDTLDGGGGIDELNYGTVSSQTTGAVINLSTNLATDGAGGTDSIVNFENVFGSNFGDTITGNAVDNVLNGSGGDDIITGGAGADNLAGGSGSDTFLYTTVTDSAIGGIDNITDFVAGGSGDKIDTNILTTLAIFGDQSTGDTLANLTLTTLNALANSSSGTLTTTLSGGSDNTDVMQLTTTDSKIIWAIDVDGSGAFDVSDTIIDVTGLTGNLNVNDFV